MLILTLGSPVGRLGRAYRDATTDQRILRDVPDAMSWITGRRARPRTVWGTVLFVAGALTALPAAAADLGSARLQIAGSRLLISPASQSVPFDTPAIVETALEGYDVALGQLPAELRVLGDFTGPEVDGTLVLETVPGEPFRIPRLRLEGEYVLADVRLVQGEEVLAYAEPRSARVRVSQIVLTRVSSRALTLDEIRAYGLAIDDESFQAMNLTFAFGTVAGTIEYTMPVVYDLYGPEVDFTSGEPKIRFPVYEDRQRNTLRTRFVPPRAVPFSVRGSLGCTGPTAKWDPSLNKYVCEVAAGGCDLRSVCRPSLEVERPAVGVLLFPTDVSLLHQFFSVALVLGNGAEEGDALVLRDLFARILLPRGLRRGETEPPTLLGQPVPVRAAGADGEVGTADDLTMIVAQAQGNAEWLIEGLQEGTHVVTVNVDGVLDGLPGAGPQPVGAEAQGAVVVRDPRLAVHVAHPRVVRAGIEYSLYYTVTNVGTAPVNLISLKLPAHALSGVVMIGPGTRAIEALAPGDSETVEFRVESQRTGRMISSSVKTGSYISPSFEWAVRVGGGELSPDVLNLPDAAEHLPPDLLEPALGLVGLGYSLATAPPSLGSGLPRVGRATVDDRVYQLSQAGRHVDLGEEAFEVAAILATDFLGRDWEWDELRRGSRKGGQLSAAVAARLSAEAASPVEVFERFAAATHYLGAQMALATGAGVTLEVASRTSGKSVAGGGVDGDRVRELPFAELYELAGGEMVVVSAPEDGGYAARLRHAAGGAAGLRLLVPDAGGEPRAVRWSGVSLTGAGAAEVRFRASDEDFVLEIDEDGDGAADRQEAGVVETVTPRAFAALAAVQVSGVDPSAHVVDVLFSEPVDLASLVPREARHFELPGNVSNGGLIQVEADITLGILEGYGTIENPLAGLSNPRVVQVVFDNPVSPLVPNTLTVRDLVGESGRVLSAQQVPVRATASTNAVQVAGTVYDPFGQPVPGATVALYESDLSGVGGNARCLRHATTARTTDAGGQFQFDYVRQTECGSVFEVRAQDPATGFHGVATGKVRLLGETLRLDVTMPGRGSVRGQVRYNDGTVPRNVRVIASSRERRNDRGRLAHVDAASGRYDLDHVVTGVVTLAADDLEGNFVYKTIELPQPGAVVEQDLVILRRSELVSTPPGQLRGRVRDAVDGSPVFDALVAISYNEDSYAAVQRTEGDGSFDFGPLPTGVVKIEVFNEKSTVSGDSAAQVWAEISPDRVTDVDVLLRNVAGTVEGHVYLKKWNGLVTPLADTVVWAEGTPYHAMTDAAGYYRLEGVYEGTWRIRSALFELEGWGEESVVAQEEVTITSAGGVVSRDLYFLEPLPQGGIIGQVLDYDAVPVAGALVHLAGGYGSIRWHHEAVSDAGGYFRIDELGAGTYGVHAMKGDDGGIGWAEIRYPGDTAWVSVRFRQGTIRGRTMARTGADGTPVGVLSQIAYRATHVHSTWQIVVIDENYTYVETDPNGYFEIPALVGPYEINVYNAFHGTRRASGALDYDGQVVEHELIFEPNGTVRGVVVDYDGETPVAGARVSIKGGNVAAYDVHTDADGRFEFPLLPPAPNGYRVEAFHDDGAIFRRGTTLAHLHKFGEEVEVEVTLSEQGSVVGWVEDAGGNPVPGAVVTLVEYDYPQRRLVHNADAEGNFAFDNVFVGKAIVTAQAPALGGLGGRSVVPLTAEAEEVVAVVRLEAVGEVVGRVTTPVDGSAVPRAEVRVVGGADFATADDAGDYRFRLLPLGWYRIKAYDQATGRRGSSEWVEIAANDQVAVADLVLESRGVVDGHLYDGNSGLTIPGAIVTLRILDRLKAFAVTDVDGYYEFEGIPEGQLSLEATDSTHRRLVREQGILAEEDERVTIDLHLAPTSQVTGQILNPVGLAAGPFAGSVNVRLLQRGATTSRTEVIDATFDNPYALQGLVAGLNFVVEAVENGGLRRGAARGRLDLAGGELVMDIRLQAIGSVTIAVVDSFGNPVSGASVVLINRHDYGQESFSASTGGGHAVAFADVREGSLVARVTDPVSGLRGTLSGELTSEGEQVTLEVQLQDTGTVRGRVVLADGVTPVAFAPAALRRGNTWYFDETDEDGNFSFTAVPLGSFELSLQEPDGLGLRDVFGALTANGEIIELGTLALDDRDPWIVSFEPPSGARDVPLAATVTVTFSEPMDASRQVTSTFVLRRRDGIAIARGYAWSTDQRALMIIPTNPLASGTTYDVYVAEETYDLAGRSLDWRQRSSFTTADVIPPAVIDTLPRGGDVQVPLDTFILVTFSEPVEPASLSGGALQLTDLTAGQGLTTTFQLRPSEREVILTPVDPLVADRDYRLTVQAVRDLAGNVMAAPAVVSFWTVDETLPELTWQSPAEGATFTSGETVPIVVDAGDNRGLDRITFAIGAWSTTLQGAQQPSATFSWEVPAPIVATSGAVTITAVLRDRFGNERTSTRDVVVEPLANAGVPAVVSDCPRDGDLVVPGLEIPIPYAIADDQSIESFWFEVDGVRVEAVTLYNQATAAGTYLWAPPAGALPGRSFDVRLGARDFAGNVGEHAARVAVPAGMLLTGEEAIDAGHAGQSLALAAGTFTWSEEVPLVELSVLHGGELLAVSPVMSLDLTGRLHVQCGGRIAANDVGYPGGDAGDTTGRAPAGLVGSAPESAGSHGGHGQQRGAGAPGEVYDSVYLPALPGGGGSKTGTPGPGGGVLTVTAAEVVVDGAIEARGKRGLASGGGGTIRVHAGALRGTGTLDAGGGERGSVLISGGYQFRAAGGGGRIALWVDDVSGFDLARATARGGWDGAAPGTVFVHTAGSTYGSLRVDGGDATAALPVTELPALGEVTFTATETVGSDLLVTGAFPFRERWPGTWIELRDGGGAGLGSFRVAERDAGGRLLVAGAGGLAGAASGRGEYRFDSMAFGPGASFTASDPVAGGALVLAGEAVVDNEIVATDVLVKSGAYVRPAGGGGLRFVLSGGMTVEAGAVIEVDGLGYPGGDASHPEGHAPAGLAGPWPSAGGSHGGVGHVIGAGPAGEVFGSVYRPRDGGGGGSSVRTSPGSAGGGVLTIEAGGAVVLDGELRSRGEKKLSRASGAGGTVFIRAASLAGSGTIDVRGADMASDLVTGSQSYYGAGGGGRVALWVDDLAGFDALSQVHAEGTHVEAGVGTLYYFTAESTYGTLVVDGGSVDPVPHTPLPALGSGGVAAVETALADLWVSGESAFRVRWLGAWAALAGAAGEDLGSYRVLEIDAAGRLRLAGAAAAIGAAGYAGEYRFDEVRLGEGVVLDVQDPLRGADWIFEQDVDVLGPIEARNVTVRSGVTVSALGGALRLHATGTVTVEAGAVLDVSGLGYDGGTSSELSGAPEGVLGSPYFTGGSHGGNGRAESGRVAGETYGSVSYPRHAGAGGGGGSQRGGAGGGTIEIDAGAVVLDGELRARGSADKNGSGAGGSVLILAGSLSGSGAIDARGEGPHCVKAGGGGRVAVWAGDLTGFDVTARVDVTGGPASCTVFGGVGTIFVHGPSSTWGDLRLVHTRGGLVDPTWLPSIERGTVGTAAADADDPANLWITPAEPEALFSVGVVGMWVRVQGVDYPVVAEGGDRRSLLLGGAAGVVAVGDAYLGLYKFDTVTVAGGARLVLRDHNEVATWDVDGASQVTLLDVSPPVFGSVTPASGSSFTSGETVTVTADVTDQETSVTGVVFEWAGQTYVDGEEPWSWTTRAPAVAAGTDTVLTIEARDTEDNLATATRTIRVEPLPPAGPPAVAITCPGPGALLPTGAGLDVDVAASHENDVEKVEVFLGADPAPVATLRTAPFLYRLEAAPTAADGDVLQLRAVARSYAATSAEAAVSVTVVTGSVLTANTFLAAGDLSLDGGTVVVSGGTLTVEGPHSFRDLVVLAGATVTHPATSASAVHALDLTLERHLYVACGAAVDALGRGYLPGYGYPNELVEGAAAGIGASHGGRGGRFDSGSAAAGRTYGSLFDPRDPGAGGGATGSAGGGVIRIIAGGEVTVDGAISVRGAGEGMFREHGAGGSIRLDGAVLRGLGTIDASGAGSSGSRAGGGGGRVALYGATIDDDLLARVLVTGGNSGIVVARGAAGTLFVKRDAQAFGELFIDNGAIASPQLTELPSVGRGFVTAIDATGFADDAADFVHSLFGVEVAFGGNLAELWPVTAHDHHGRRLELDTASAALTAQVGDAYEGVYRFDRVVVRGGARVLARDQLVLGQAADVEPGSELIAGYLPGVVITEPADGATFTAGDAISVAATVDDLYGVTEVRLTFDGQTQAGTAPYAWTITAPEVAQATDMPVTIEVDDLSGHRLSATHTVTVQPNLNVTPPAVAMAACPADQDLVTPAATVDFAFTATDDDGVASYGLLIDGVEVDGWSGLSQTAVSGVLSWTVPAGASPGTVYQVRVEARDFAGSVGFETRQVRVPTGTLLTGDQSLDGAYDAASLTLGDGVFTVTEPLSLAGLHLAHGATLRGEAEEVLDLTVSGAVTLQCDTSMDVTGLGFARHETYPGATVPGDASGGSHLGVGGQFSTSAVGSTYGSVYRPQEPGGGSESTSVNYGRPGGGVVRIRAAGVTLAAGSAIRANGVGYVSGDYGTVRGGAGGSVWITATGAIAGDGTIEALGGASGNNNRGSGGGGAIAVEYGSSSGTVLENLRAWGGQHTVVGGAGTICLAGPAADHGDLIVDNGGLSGQGTKLPALGGGAAQAGSTGSLLVTDRAVAIPPYFVGHWVQVSAADATPKGTYRIASVNGTSATLDADAGETIALEPGDLWQGVYRFDLVTVVGGAALTSDDPVFESGLPLELAVSSGPLTPQPPLPEGEGGPIPDVLPSPSGRGAGGEGSRAKLAKFPEE